MELELEDVIQSLTTQISEYARRVAMLEATIAAMQRDTDDDSDTVTKPT